jgi:hypothetical protein
MSLRSFVFYGIIQNDDEPLCLGDQTGMIVPIPINTAPPPTDPVQFSDYLREQFVDPGSVSPLFRNDDTFVLDDVYRWELYAVRVKKDKATFYGVPSPTETVLDKLQHRNMNWWLATQGEKAFVIVGYLNGMSEVSSPSSRNPTLIPPSRTVVTRSQQMRPPPPPSTGAPDTLMNYTWHYEAPQVHSDSRQYPETELFEKLGTLRVTHELPKFNNHWRVAMVVIDNGRDLDGELLLMIPKEPLQVTHSRLGFRQAFGRKLWIGFAAELVDPVDQLLGQQRVPSSFVPANE